uniref:lymphatic vessel endothelial hyaluronic acid receptor 1-like n=1 Tax=Pristiophorus japonicus TaxID=55135 RepID=UPI00398ECEF1
MEKWGALTLVALSQAFLVTPQAPLDVTGDPQTPIDFNDIIIGSCRILGVFHIQFYADYQLTLAQAHAACNFVGTVLATKAQVESAHQQGFEMCRYGWVNDGFAVIPRIQPNGLCGKNKTGIVIWRLANDTAFDGYCFRHNDARKTNTCEPFFFQTTTVIMNPTEMSEMDLGSTSTETVTVFSSESIPLLDTKTTRLPQETSTFLLSLISTTPCASVSAEPYNVPAIVQGNKVSRNRIIYCALGVVAIILLVVFVAVGVYYVRRRKKSFSYSSTGQPKEDIEAEVWSHSLLEKNSS